MYIPSSQTIYSHPPRQPLSHSIPSPSPCISDPLLSNTLPLSPALSLSCSPSLSLPTFLSKSLSLSPSLSLSLSLQVSLSHTHTLPLLLPLSLSDLLPPSPCPFSLTNTRARARPRSFCLALSLSPTSFSPSLSISLANTHKEAHIHTTHTPTLPPSLSLSPFHSSNLSVMLPVILCPPSCLYPRVTPLPLLTSTSNSKKKHKTTTSVLLSFSLSLSLSLCHWLSVSCSLSHSFSTPFLPTSLSISHSLFSVPLSLCLSHPLVLSLTQTHSAFSLSLAQLSLLRSCLSVAIFFSPPPKSHDQLLPSHGPRGPWPGSTHPATRLHTQRPNGPSVQCVWSWCCRRFFSFSFLIFCSWRSNYAVSSLKVT